MVHRVPARAARSFSLLGHLCRRPSRVRAPRCRYRGLTELTVSLEDAAELRRIITLLNHSNRLRQLEVTSYTELALARAQRRPGSSRLQQAVRPDRSLCRARNPLLAWRTPRSPQDQPVWAAQVLAWSPAVDSAEQTVQVETDRARFVGRGTPRRTPRHLRAISRTHRLVARPDV